MSWDAQLNCKSCQLPVGRWNYTHNTNAMVRSLDWYPYDVPWWEHLNGLEGPDGAKWLDLIITGLEADPERFRAMNPANGWGDYDTFLIVLKEMRSAVSEVPTVWEAHG